MAEFKTLPNSQPLSADMSIIKYFNLDILVLIVAALFISFKVISIIFYLLRLCLNNVRVRFVSIDIMKKNKLM